MNAAQYRDTCTLRRNGHVVEERAGDGWTKVNLDHYQSLAVAKEGQEPIKGINRAKRYVRNDGGRSYNV